MLVAKDNFHGYQLEIDYNNKVYASVWLNGTRKSVHGLTACSLGEWHHFAMTFDGSVIRVYLDGKLDGSVNAVGMIDDTSQYDLLIGKDSISGGAYRAYGTIDEVKIYDIALSTEEIAADIIIDPANNPPAIPQIPTGPASGDFGVPYSFSTFTTDPDGNRVKYIFDWGNGITSVTPYYNSGEVVNLTHMWSDKTGIHDVRVKAMDETGAESSWSETAQMDIVAIPSTPPVINLSVTSIIIGEDRATSINLSGHASDAEDPETELVWSIADVDASLIYCWIIPPANIKLQIQSHNNVSGEDTITLILTDSGGMTDTHNILVRVTPINDPPILNPIGNKNVNENGLLTFTAAASDIDSTILTYSATLSNGTPLPKGASIDPVTGIFTWTPSYFQQGTYQIKIKVTDDGGASDYEIITVTVIDVDTIEVGGPNPDYATIQQAIDDTPSGNIVYIFSGTYVENINMKDDVHLIGEDIKTTIIKGNMIFIEEDTSIEGFSIIYGEGEDVIFTNSVYTGCKISSDAGITAINSEITVKNCIIKPNPDVFTENFGNGFFNNTHNVWCDEIQGECTPVPGNLYENPEFNADYIPQNAACNGKGYSF